MFEKNLINKWKKEHKRVFKVEISGNVFYYRRLTVGEIRTVSLCEDQEQKELRILKSGVLHPQINTLLDIPAGAADNLVSLISKVTEATEESILKKVSDERDRMGMTDDYLKWKVEIIKTLNYTPREIDKMTIDEFVEALVMAEEVQGRPLVASGEDDGSSISEPATKTTDTSLPTEGVETNDPLSQDVANSLAIRLRNEYLAGKKRRQRFGRV